MPDFTLQIPEGDSRDRLVCAMCGHIDYQNPKVVVGAVVGLDGRVLLCRRAIEPRRGFWTLPAGYLELGETVEGRALREAYEEAQVRIALDGILAIYSISRIGQVQVIFRAGFADPARPEYGAGPESEAVELFAWEDIPWTEIAFPSVRWALTAWRETLGGGLAAPAGNPAADPRGTGVLAAS